MKNDEEMYQSLLMRFEKYQAKKRMQRLVIRCTVPAAVCLCIAAAGYGHRHSLMELPPVPVVTETEDGTAAEAPAEKSTQAAAETMPSVTAGKTVQTTAAMETQTSADTAAAAVQTETAESEACAEVKTAAVTQPEAPTAAAVTAAPTAPPAAEKPVRTTESPVTEPPAVRTSEPPAPPVIPAAPGSPGGVYTQISVSYEEARERFGHPIVQCTRGDFTGYKAAMVSQNGDITSERAFCLEVIYQFTDGYLAVRDNERFGSASPQSDETVEYNGRTFYIGQPEYNYGQYYIGCFPSLEGGIVYQGFFASDCDIYEKMDIIISLLI